MKPAFIVVGIFCVGVYLSTLLPVYVDIKIEPKPIDTNNIPGTATSVEVHTVTGDELLEFIANGREML
jgi:hypothetical protein